ncbi:hypothetical protein BS78_03G005100 [Paspalum vaginatum]|nr:hypothetical protein BS78_03G005100 [Paspalum vaginatum]
MPPRHRPPGAAASASVAPPADAFLSPGVCGAAKRGRFVEHLAPEGGGVSGCWGDRDVPPELLPLKKRIVRHHPYAAALAIQEMAMDHLDGLRAELLRLRISRPALVLTKPLTLSDRSRDNARLVLPDGLVAPSPLLGMLTPLERRLVFGAGLPVPALDRLGRAYRMTLRRDPSARTYRLAGQWSLFVSRHDMAAGDAVEVRASRSAARVGSGWRCCTCTGTAAGGSSGRQQGRYHWCSRELDAADGLLRFAAANRSSSSRSSSVVNWGGRTYHRLSSIFTGFCQALIIFVVELMEFLDAVILELHYSSATLTQLQGYAGTGSVIYI